VIAGRLIELGAKVRGYDPAVEAGSGRVAPPIEVCADPFEACEGANVLAVLTEWDEFRWLDFDRVRSTMTTPAIVDARNLLDPAALRRRGFSYTAVGR
jgi:UDPglucose 6-dehydrogenase